VSTDGDEEEERKDKGVEGGGEDEVDKNKKEELGPLVVFACRHFWHRRCLVRAMDDGKEGGEVSGAKRRFRCPICP